MLSDIRFERLRFFYLKADASDRPERSRRNLRRAQESDTAETLAAIVLMDIQPNRRLLKFEIGDSG
jgi:hypothetical protein